MLSLRANIVERERERERERVNSTASEWRVVSALIVVLFAIIGVCCYFGIQNSANAVPNSVNFNAVTIRNGAKIYVNSNKSLTAVDNGNKLVADNTNGTAVKGDGISSALNSFAGSNYGNDALFNSEAITNPSCLSINEINSYSMYLPSVESAYWLSDRKSEYGLDLTGVVGRDNTFLDVKRNSVKGRVSNTLYDGDDLSFGSYDLTKDYKFDNIMQLANSSIWYQNYEGNSLVKVYNIKDSYQGEAGILKPNGDVWNNPFLIDDPLRGLYKSTTNLGDSVHSVVGRVSIIDGVAYHYQLRPGSKLYDGDIVFNICRIGKNSYISDKDETHFKPGSRGNEYAGYTAYYFRVEGNWTVDGPRSMGEKYIWGVRNYSPVESEIQGSTIEGGQYCIRPAYSLTRGNIAFLRSNTSNATLSTSSKFGDLPTSGANYNDNKKAVVKSSNTTIRSNISSGSNLSVAGTGGSATYTSSSNTINVPYGATNLSLNSSSFTTSNANYISALANANTGTQKYAILGRTGVSVTLDLISILNNTQIGSKATVSFYAEQANVANNSDVISATPVTFDISVVAGANQTITYNRGDGTSGTVPSSATVQAGKSYSFADGTGLSKDGNPFSCWKVTYTRYGQTTQTTRFIKGGEAITVPDTTTGNITATALYSGVKATKSTQSKSTVATVTWDTNAPSGFDATFDGTGSFNDEKTKRYDKSLVNGTVTAPAAPVLSGGTGTRIFDGWNTKKDGTGTTLKVNEVTPALTSNTVYYAQWIEGYEVTYVVTGGEGASQTGKWSDGMTADVDEIVLPGKSTVGPSKGTPVADDPSYMFYGWYNSPKGAGGKFNEKGTSFETLGGNKTVYAYYVFANTFLAPASRTANPRNIEGDKYPIADVKEAATDIASNGSSSSYYSQYESWMNGDSYHLYTLLNGKDASNADSWVEFRIVHVGGLDSDGTGLTFQAVHMLPTAYQMNSSDTNAGGWASSALRAKMQSGGEIYSMFDAQLTSRVLSVTRNSKGKLWIPSYSELTGTTRSDISSDGSQFAYWKDKVTNPNGSNGCLAIAGTRSGGSVASIDNYSSGCWWERTPSTTQSIIFMYVYSSGMANSRNAASSSLGVVPCLSL